MIHGRVIVARARAIRNGFREERRLTRACRGLWFRDGTWSRRCSRSRGVVPPIHRHCCTTNNKDSTHNVQGHARHLSLAEGVQGRAIMIRNTRARILRPQSGRYISRKVITRLPRSFGIANYACMCAATASAYVMTAITCTASALWNAPQFETHSITLPRTSMYVWRWRSMLLYKREMQNDFFVKLI